MIYYKITRTWEPSIIGINDASAQVEICKRKDKYSFENKRAEKYFYDYVNQFLFTKKDNLKLLSFDNYNMINNKIINHLTLFKTKKTS